LTFTEDKFYATITIPHGSQSVDPIFKKLMADDNADVLDQYLDGTVREDIAPEIKDVIIASLPDGALDYRFIEFTTAPSSSILQLALDRNLIETIALPIIKKYTYPGAVPILPLFSVSTTPPIPNDLKDLKLVDYKVRILNTGTNATTRVSIESTDKNGKSWFTIGVSPNIIEASFKALVDSLDYKLYKEKAPANN